MPMKCLSIFLGEQVDKPAAQPEPAPKAVQDKTTLQASEAALKYARLLLVKCPQFDGQDLHCWYCSRCANETTCQAVPARLKPEVADFKKYGKPYSLHLIEETLPPEDTTLPAWEDICPDYYKGCFACQSYQRGTPAFCGKYSRGGRLLS